MLELGHSLSFVYRAAGEREDVFAEVCAVSRGSADDDSVLAREVDEAFACCVKAARVDGADHHAIWSGRPRCPCKRFERRVRP